MKEWNIKESTHYHLIGEPIQRLQFLLSTRGKFNVSSGVRREGLAIIARQGPKRGEGVSDREVVGT